VSPLEEAGAISELIDAFAQRGRNENDPERRREPLWVQHLSLLRRLAAVISQKRTSRHDRDRHQFAGAMFIFLNCSMGDSRFLQPLLEFWIWHKLVLGFYGLVC